MPIHRNRYLRTGRRSRRKKNKDWIESPLREIPRELPALTRASKVLKRIDKYYEGGSTYEQNVDGLIRSAEALRACRSETCSKELEQIMADMLLKLSDIARIRKISQEQVLTDHIEDLIDRYEKPKAGDSESK